MSENNQEDLSGLLQLERDLGRRIEGVGHVLRRGPSGAGSLLVDMAPPVLRSSFDRGKVGLAL